MLIDLLEESLDYLSTQYVPTGFSLMYSQILEENGMPYESASKVELWLNLYSNEDVLMLTNTGVSNLVEKNVQYGVKKQIPSSGFGELKKKFLKSKEFEELMDATKLLCSNSVRIRKLNLVFYDNIVRNFERYRILLCIASKRYNGCWQYDLSNELSISPRNLFTYLSSLCKLFLVYKLTIPQNRISKHIMNITLNNIDVTECDTKGDSQQDVEEGLTPHVQNSTSICFFSKYFVLDKLPEYIRTTCFRSSTKDAEGRLLGMLERAENHILLESDWKAEYFDMALEEFSLLNSKIDSRIISRSYVSFRRSLELKNKVRRLFGWCPQTKRFERCIILIKVSEEMDKLDLKETVDFSGRLVNILNLNTCRMPDSESSTLAELPHKIMYQFPLDFYGHSICELVYYVIKCNSGGIVATDINTHLSIKYKQLTKIISAMEAVGIIRKETNRLGKVFMYRYFVKDGDEINKLKISSIEKIASGLPQEGNIETATNDDVSQKDTLYLRFLANQKSLYRNDSDYMGDYNRIFGGFIELSKHLNTKLFKKRMVLFHNYLECFKAASLSNISLFYSDMENSKSKVDRKTVIRVSQCVLSVLPHIRSLKCDEIKGVSSSITVLYDSTHFNGLDAFNYVQSDISRKRNIVSIHAATLHSKINKSFKNLEDINSIVERSVDIKGDELDISVRSKINMETPCLLKDVVVNQKYNQDVKNNVLLTFSQRNLSENGYIFPIVTRLKRLHLFLIDIFHKGIKFTTEQIINSMTVEVYLQVIGCGYEIPNITQLLKSGKTMGQIPETVFSSLCLRRGKRDSAQLLNKLLTLLHRMKLVTMNEVYTQTTISHAVREFSIEWEIHTCVNLCGFADPDVVIGSYDLLNAPEKYWQSLKSEVDNYINVNNREPPIGMPIKELFVKKNWKTVFYLTGTIRSQLDRSILAWINLSYNRLHYKSFVKHFYVPSHIVSMLSKKFNVSQSHICRYVLNKVRHMNSSISYETDDLIIQKIVSNISKHAEYLWMARFVISERLCNSVFYNMNEDTDRCFSLAHLGLLYERSFNDSSDYTEKFAIEKDEDVASKNAVSICTPKQSTGLGYIWIFMSILFNNRYTPEECRHIFDYMINKSNVNLRILRRFRELKSEEIMDYALKCHIPILRLSSNKAIGHHLSRSILKSIMLTVTMNSRPWFLPNWQESKKLKYVLRLWIDNGWIVKTKKMTHFFGKYKLSTFSKLKLFGRYSEFYFNSNILLSHLNLASSNDYKVFSLSDESMSEDFPDRSLGMSPSSSGYGVISSNCLNLDPYSVYNIIEHFAKGSIELEPVWKVEEIKAKKQKLNYSALIDGGISRHINVLNTNTMSISAVEGRIPESLHKLLMVKDKPPDYSTELLDFDDTHNDKQKNKITTRELVCGSQFSDALDPIHCNPLYLSEKINKNFPVQNFEYETDNVNHWWNDKNFTHFLKFSDTPSKNLASSAYSLFDIFDHIIEVLYSDRSEELKKSFKSIDRLLFKLVVMIKDAGEAGLPWTRLETDFGKAMRNEIRGESYDFNHFDAMINVLLVSAEVLRFITRLAANEDYIYIYWEYCSLLFIDRQKIIAIRTHVEYKSKEENTYSNTLTRPDYISPRFWLLWEDTISEYFDHENLDRYLGPLRKLLNKGNLEKYMKNCNRAHLNIFIALDGHLNRCLLAFVSLKIYTLIREFPGQTAGEIWRRLVIFDLCEVEMLLQGMCDIGVISVKHMKCPADVNKYESFTSSGVCGFRQRSVRRGVELYYVCNSSHALWWFRHALLPFNRNIS